jgi:class 3 adenylate cyclase
MDGASERELELSFALDGGGSGGGTSFDGMDASIESTYSELRTLTTLTSVGSATMVAASALNARGTTVHAVHAKEAVAGFGGDKASSNEQAKLRRGSAGRVKKRSTLKHGNISAADMLPQQSMTALPSWMAHSSIPSTALPDAHRVDIQDIKPHNCALFFTSKSRSTSCCCCPRRRLQVGSIALYDLLPGGEVAADNNNNNNKSAGAPNYIEVEIFYQHRNGLFDVVDDEGVERLRVLPSSLRPRPSDELDLGEAKSCCGCVSIPGIENRWQETSSHRTKIKLRVGSFLFVLINIVLAVVDSTNTTAPHLTWWVSAGYFNSTAYRNNPFCSQTRTPVSDTIAEQAGSPLDPPERTASNLVALRSVGVIIPSLALMLFSWTSAYTDNKRVRMGVTYCFAAAMGVAVGFISSYKFCNWYQVSYLRRGMFDVFPRIFPRIPGQGLMLFFQTFVLHYMSLPSYVALACSVLSLWTWYVVSVFQFISVPIQMSFGSAHGTILFEMVLLFLLCGMCYYQTYSRERYARWDFLQKEILEIQRAALSQNQKTANRLLQSMLPATIIEKLKSGKPVMAEMYNPVTVLFAELCDFSDVCAVVSPQEIVWILNEVFTKWDEITDLHSVHKVETVGEVYMAVAGCPIRVSNHAELAACCALDMIAAMEKIRERVRKEITEEDRQSVCDVLDDKTPTLDAHVGLNTGRINAGVVGTNNPRFKLFGDTVNMASRMESTCPHGCVQVSAATQRCIKDYFVLKDRGLVQIKGKGEQLTYLLEGHLAGAPRVRQPILCQKVEADGSSDRERNDGFSTESKLTERALQDRVTLPVLPVLVAVAAADDSEGKGTDTGDDGRKDGSEDDCPEQLPSRESIMSTATSRASSLSLSDAGSTRNNSNNSSNEATRLQRKNFSLHVNFRVETRKWSDRARDRVKHERAKWKRSTKRHTHGRQTPQKRRSLNRTAHRKRGHSRAVTMGGGGVSVGSGLAKQLGLLTDSAATAAAAASTNAFDGDGGILSSDVAGVEAIQNLVSKPGTLSENQMMSRSRSDSEVSRGKALSGSSLVSIISKEDLSESTLERYFWPELHKSGRRMYRLMRCLTRSEMKEINFDLLQTNHHKFQKFQHAKYYRTTVFTVLLYSLFFSLLTFYDHIQWNPIYNKALSVLLKLGGDGNASLAFSDASTSTVTLQSAELYFGSNVTSASNLNVATASVARWKKVNAVFLRVLLRTGVIGSLYIALVIATLYSRKIPRRTFLMTLLMIGVTVIILCFETGCHGDNTYFVVFATSVYLLSGLPVYGRLGVLLCIAVGYFASGLVTQRLSPAALLDLIIIIIALVMSAFPQLQQQHYERLNHSQSIQLVRSRHEESQESRQIVKLLGKLLPMSVIRELASGRDLIADPYEDVTIIFTDVSKRGL